MKKQKQKSEIEQLTDEQLKLMPYYDKAIEALTNFVEEINKNGFTDKIFDKLNLAWQTNKEVFVNALMMLKGVEFEVKDVKFKSFDKQKQMYTFECSVNGETTSLFVQSLIKGYFPTERGHFGVIPSKLMRFAKVEAEASDHTEEDKE